LAGLATWDYYLDEVLTSMQGALRERWFDLCAQAIIEQDPDRLLQLAHEINRLLEEKEQRLQTARGK